MKEFFRSYWELQKQSFTWVKKHWIGYLIFVGVITLIEWIVIWLLYFKEDKKEYSDYERTEI